MPCLAHFLQSMNRPLGFYFLFNCLPSHPFAGALIKLIIYPDSEWITHGAASLSGKLRPQVIPADSNTLHCWRDKGCNKYPLLSI